jgi:hypothetical protein
MLCSASVNALQIVFSKSSYESTAKWESCQILKRTNCWCVFSWSIYNQNGHFIQCIQCRVFKVVMAYTDHGKISAKRNRGWKPKISERDRSTLKRIVCKNQNYCSKRQQQNLIFNLKTPFPQKQPDKSFTNPMSIVELELLNLWLLKTTLQDEKGGVMIIKPGHLIIGNM